MGKSLSLCLNSSIQVQNDVTAPNYLYPVLAAITADCFQPIVEAFSVQNLLLFLFPDDHKWISRNSNLQHLLILEYWEAAEFGKIVR